MSSTNVWLIQVWLLWTVSLQFNKDETAWRTKMCKCRKWWVVICNILTADYRNKFKRKHMRSVCGKIRYTYLPITSPILPFEQLCSQLVVLKLYERTWTRNLHINQMYRIQWTGWLSALEKDCNLWTECCWIPL